MRDFARKFYSSKAWKRVRRYVDEDRDHKLCQRCGKPGRIVHHKKHLTPDNIDDPYISLNPDMLETLCEECHSIEHNGEAALDSELTFSESGDISYTDAALYGGAVQMREHETPTAQGLVFDADGNLIERSE